MKERRKTNFKQKKPFSIFVLSDKLEKEIHPHSPKKNHTHQSKSTTFSPTHEKQNNTKFVRY